MSNGTPPHGTPRPQFRLPERKPSSPAARFVRWTMFAAMIAGGWYTRPFWWPWLAPLVVHGGGAPVKAGPRAIPVRTAVVQQRDMDLYLNGLGTVTAFRTVVLKSRIDGELVKVLFSEGQMVNEGDLLAEIDPRPYEAQLGQAQGQLARDQATLELAKLTLSRNQDLLKRKSISQQEVDTQAALVQQTEGTIKVDEALVDMAKLQVMYCKITAPVTGRIGLRVVDPGNIVRANDLAGMAVITQLQPISLVFTIPQDEIPRVQKQTQAGKQLIVEAYDRDFKTKLATGYLTAIDNQVDSTTGTLRLKSRFDNADGRLFPNQFVNVRLLVDTKPAAILVPAAAVQRGPSSTFVYVLKKDEGTVDLRTVTVGPTEGAETAIETGLSAGEVVVTDGIDKLQPGTKVTTPEQEKKDGKGHREGKDRKDEAGEKEKPEGKSESKDGKHEKKSKE